jgi:hypothetical protein
LFGNWGKVPSNTRVRERVIMQLNRQPAQIVCLAEAEELVEATLRSPPILTDSTGAASSAVAVETSTSTFDALFARSSVEHLVIRGREEVSLLMVVRLNIAKSLECIYWERRFEGEYTHKRRRKRSYSRGMVGKVILDQSIGHFGEEIRVMVVHMHNVLANDKWPSKLKGFGDWCHGICVEHQVDVLMGDFDMSFFRVIPELRSRGATIDLAACYPWTT